MTLSHDLIVREPHVGFDDYGPRVGYDVPLPNGCWKCIGCGVILPKHRDWNQCSECDTRDPEDY